MNEQVNSLNISKGINLLPIGSVVAIPYIQQALMIYGRGQHQGESGKKWDYVACPYPQGHISEETNVFFNHEQIEKVIFKGLETDGEVELRKLLDELNEKAAGSENDFI